MSDKLYFKNAWLNKIRPQEFGWFVGYSRGEKFYSSLQFPEYIVGPTRMGKGVNFMCNAILEAPGAVVSTTTRSDNMDATVKYRQDKYGNCYLFDLEDIYKKGHTFKYNLLAGCEQPLMAQKKAGVMLSSTGMQGTDNQVWAAASIDILTALLHAAALNGGDIHQFYSWTQNIQRIKEAINILRHSNSNQHWDDTLEKFLSEDTKMQQNKFFGVQQSFASIKVKEIRDKLNVPFNRLTDIKQMLLNKGTLYLASSFRQASTSGGSSTSTGIFISAILNDIVEGSTVV